MDLLGGHQRESLIQVEAHLVTKYAFGARVRSVRFGNTLGVDMVHEIFVLAAYWAHGVCVKVNYLKFKCSQSDLPWLRFLCQIALTMDVVTSKVFSSEKIII